VGEIDPGAVRTAASYVEYAAAIARKNVPDEVGDVATALSGSASGAAATSLATAWSTALGDWATSAETHAQGMRDAAAAWETTNQGVASRFDRHGQAVR
jgi:hypothetical protein